MADFEGETWVEIYQKALLELEHAKMRGRIGDARAAIKARIEKLREIPSLRAREHQAIEDALNALGFLEHEEEAFHGAFCTYATVLVIKGGLHGRL